MEHLITDVLQPLSIFGGIAFIIWASAKARLMHRQQDIKERQAASSPPQSDAVLAEVKALSAKMEQMQGTGHQFDLAFDAALERMEQRVVRLETKAVASAAVPADPPVLRNGMNTSGE